MYNILILYSQNIWMNYYKQNENYRKMIFFEYINILNIFLCIIAIYILKYIEYNSIIAPKKTVSIF